MANAADIFNQIEGIADPLGLFGVSAPGTTKEKKAEEARRKAMKQAQDELEFTKAIWEQNNADVSAFGDTLFGRSPEEIAQGLAADRALQGGTTSSGVTTPSGRSGRFDFGSSGQAPVSIPEDRLRNLYDSSRQFTEEEFKKRVKALEAETGSAALTDEQIRNLYDTGRNKSFDDYKNAHNQHQQGAQQTAAVENAEVTDFDRQRAAQIAKESQKNTLPGRLDASWQERKSAADKLKEAIDGVDRVDPGEFQDEWLVDANKEYISPEAKQAQKQVMDKTWALTDTKETAEEKFMREVARRSQERDLRAQSEAQASQLRARGAYGSGAELAGFLGAQQELAQRRSLEEMAANANAQKRAMQALGEYGNQSFQLGSQDIAVGGLRDVNDRFNKTNKQDWQKFKTKTEQEENDAYLKREATKYDAGQKLQDDKDNNTRTEMDAGFRLLGAKTGNNLAGSAPVVDSTRNLGANFKGEENYFNAGDAADKNSGWLF